MDVVAAAPPEIQTEMVWTNLPSSWGVFVFLAVVLALVYGVVTLYRREPAAGPAWKRALLAGLRVTALLLLAGIFLGPAVVEVQQRVLQPTIVVLRDASQSMSTADGNVGSAGSATATRADVVNRLLSSDLSSLLGRLQEKGHVELFDFADQVTRVELGAGHVAPKLTPNGRGTDLTGAIRHALRTSRPSAIVVFSDGQQTAPQSVEEAAREAAVQETPLYLVGIGTEVRSRSLKVASVYARPQAWQQEPFEIEAVIAFDHREAGRVKVDLLETKIEPDRPVAEPGKLVASQEITLPESGSGQQTVRLMHAAAEPGQYTYEVRLAAPASEPETGNHAAVSNVVKVLSREQLRVLLLAGAPTWDFRLVARLLARDKTMSLSCWLQTLEEGRAQEGTRPIAQLPATKDALFAYDVVLLFDPDSREFDAAWIDLLKEFVGQHAGGLVYMAGPKFTARFLTQPRTSGISDLLPVTFGDLEAGEIQSLLSSGSRAWPLEVAAANSDHALLRFEADSQQSAKLWEALPGVFWSFPCQAGRPAAELLLVHSDPSLRGTNGPRPLLVAGRYGAGHTLYMGFADTWRWRRAANDAQLFDQFWIQTIRYLAEGRSLAGHRRGTLETDRQQYELGEAVTLRARLVGPTYEPLEAPRLTAKMEAPGRPAQDIVLLPVAGQPGRFEATFTASQTGVHRVEVALSGADDAPAEPVVVESSFRVDVPSAESSRLWMNRPLLTELARISGGRFFEAGEVAALPEAIPDRSETIASRGPPRPLWDTGGMLAVLVGLLCSEWLLRKYSKLL